MTGTRQARSAVARALAAACVALLCLFASGPAAVPAAGGAHAVRQLPSGTPADPGTPTERESDPASDSEVRVAVRPSARGLPSARELPRPVFHVKPPTGPVHAARDGAAEPALSVGTVRSVVLRC
ncbi:hypothetical protein ACSHWO_16660 [Streptomyces sp. HUAS TT3]|uniref:hypothetical protein n=1 Tax=Streptomyces sp. HUAS TT3 TaxID=3447510 RepID=UPI003F65BB60